MIWIFYTNIFVILIWISEPLRFDLLGKRDILVMFKKKH
jgi:hypothetical protein